MIQRIVKLSFHQEHIPAFLEYFNQRKDLIASFPGCAEVKLLQQSDNPEVFFTYSVWHTEGDLENYRVSPVFTETWATVKKYFNKKPEAWSLRVL